MAEAEGKAQVTLIATGSEVAMAVDARDALQAEGIGTRLVNLSCWEAFSEESPAYRTEVLGDVPRLSVEAASTFGWQRWTGETGATIGIDRFGASAPGAVLAEKLGISVANIVQTAKALL